MRTDEFAASLPRGPFVQHIRQVHAVLVYQNQCSGVNSDPNALAVAEHSLREIARYSAVDPRAEYGMPERRMCEEPSQAANPADFLHGMKRAFAGLGDRMREIAESVNAKDTPERIESRGERRLTRIIENERRPGREFVKAEARRVRKELGL